VQIVNLSDEWHHCEVPLEPTELVQFAAVVPKRADSVALYFCPACKSYRARAQFGVEPHEVWGYFAENVLAILRDAIDGGVVIDVDPATGLFVETVIPPRERRESW